MRIHWNHFIALIGLILAQGSALQSTDLIINGDFENGLKGQLGVTGS